MGRARDPGECARLSVCREHQLYLLGIDQTRIEPDVRSLTFHTTRGDFEALARYREGMKKGAIVLGDPDSGSDGPSKIYPDLAKDLLDRDVGSLRLSYRSPGNCVQSAIDVLLALQYLDDEGIHDVVLVGWSFGAAVAISAGSLARTVRGIAAISMLDVSDCCVKRLHSKPLLLLHGDADEVSPVEVSRRVYFKCDEPRRLIVYSGADHNCHEARDRLRSDLRRWILKTLRATKTAT